MRDWAREIIRYLSDYALFWPGVFLAAVVALILGGRVARRLRTVAPIGFLLVFGLGLIAAATLTPSRDALRFGALGNPTCDTSRIGLVPLDAILHVRDPAFNLALYLPLGLAIGMLPGGRARRGLIVASLLLSPAIELTQLLVRPLGRACQTSDMSDNITGLLIGLAAGWLIARAIGLYRSGPDQPSAIDASSPPAAAPDGSAGPVPPA
jgi:glycopeptide antibiotics resistance protein